MFQDSWYFQGPMHQLSAQNKQSVIKNRYHLTTNLSQQALFTLTLALSTPGFCLGIIWRQWDKTTNDFGKMLSSPLLVFPEW